MSTASEEQRNLDLLKAAQLMLKHGISPEGELQAALISQPSLPEERSACPREHPQPLDLRPYQAQALANLLGRDDTYGYGGDVTVFNEAAIAIHSAFTHLNLLWARESGSNPPDVGETPLAASSASQGSD